MICIDFNGRCGDQFFQYAFARKIQLATNNKEKMIFNFYNEKRWRDKLNDDSFRNDLAFFNIIDNKSFDSEVENIYVFGSKRQIHLLKKYKKISKYLRKFNLTKIAKHFQKRLQINGIYYDDCFFDLYSYPRKEGNVFLKGYFENYKYYYNNDELIKTLKEELNPLHHNLEDDELLTVVKKTNSVCLSMRSWGEVSKFDAIIKSRQVCDFNYYKNAISLMKKIHPDCTFIVFSDDVNWARKIIGHDESFLFEEKKYDICDKILLMRNCKHFIISNSSFSWWVQFLSPHQHKTIISPSKWYNDKKDDRLINPEWNILKISDE